ncbi:hypothetical protein MTR67_039450 [Solanum verrucosum]|uniref:RNase H type-1 domain-containing protein n=1 Tax=Solanum verrucosum TaxID=315347 RepID=A0AAF0UHY6_SOLVR|nr:hypothetical protein MTR67_039450 [Solanum verrucosum]
MPIIISWNLWKNGCSAKYGGKQSSSARTKFMIFKDTSMLLNTVFPYLQWPNSWPEMISYVQQCSQEIGVRPVIWNKPPVNYCKLNTDGSALANPGSIGGGGILRDQAGNIIFAFTVPLGTGFNNQAEVQATVFGLNWCYQHGYRKIVLEVDSELITRWINFNIKPP